MAKQQEVTKVPEEEVDTPPAFLADMKEDAGKGLSNRPEDYLVPLIYILQTGSPQVNKRGPDYIEGAEPGDIWLRDAPNPIVKGDTGIWFQTCHFSINWVEWVPRGEGGGRGASHASLPKEAREKKDPETGQSKLYMPNGNEITETRYHSGYVFSTPDGPTMPYVIAFSSTGHTVSKRWMTAMSNRTSGHGQSAIWQCIWLLKTKLRTNAKGTWSTWEVSKSLWIRDRELVERGKTTNGAFAAGTKAIEAPTSDHRAEETEDSPM